MDLFTFHVNNKVNFDHKFPFLYGTIRHQFFRPSDHLIKRTVGQGFLVIGKCDELIAKYADELQNKYNMVMDTDFLKKVTIGCGPAI